MATDSRLRFGCAWDCCPKLFPLARGDSAICFAGNTMYAYPIVLQVQAAVDGHLRTRTRAQDLSDLKGHLLRIANDMCAQIYDLPVGQSEQDSPDVDFLLGGFSWKRGSFCLWRLHFDAHIKRFTFRPAARWRGISGNRLFAAVGDSVPEARARLVALLRKRNKLVHGGFDMEPFEVLRDMIRDKVDPAIGGAPQLVKIHRHMNVRVHAVRWPGDDAPTITLLGRPLLAYERTQNLVLNPDSLESAATWEYDDPVE